MTSHSTSISEGASARGFVFVVLAYRCAMAETCGALPLYRAGVREVFEAAAPEGEAEQLFGHFFGFVRSLQLADRPIQWRRAFCAHLCRDEWLVISMIEAAQRGDVASLLKVATDLLGPEELGAALDATQTLATALTQSGVRLCRDPAGARPTLH